MRIHITSMEVVGVTYELFESEVQSFESEMDGPFHELDREVKLIGSRGETRYISWHSEPYQYCIWTSDQSGFTGEFASMDMTGSEMWKEIVAEEVRIGYEEGDYQILEIRSRKGTVYCCSWDSHGAWGMDVVRITRDCPPKSGSYKAYLDGSYPVIDGPPLFDQVNKFIAHEGADALLLLIFLGAPWLLLLWTPWVTIGISILILVMKFYRSEGFIPAVEMVVFLNAVTTLAVGIYLLFT